ncbi:MAG TPA: response regulator [Candidatus Acidoferrales bacterium]|nr:response regulator [Candidatus Acidoferrales bacterium]
MPKILVADDNANIQKMVALSFEDRGVAVVSVGNGEAAVRRIPDLKPDLVLADIFMPVRNGYEVCEFVKKDERFSHVPVILLVGAFDPLDEKEARRVGADGVLKKPFVPPDPLIAMVMSALEKNPKVAAELAKAREAKEAPPMVIESIPEPATSARAELKPLPDFPEPTPEEAALVYGFGTGRRALDDAPSEAEMSNEPKPPVAESEEVAEDDFDESSTARDWRRNAMEIEIPPEAVNKPAFATDLDSSQFPSEREVPPRRVPFPKEEEVENTNSLATFEAPTPAEPMSAEVPEPASASAPGPDFFAPTDPTPVVEAEATVAHPAPFEPEPAPDVETAPQSGPSHWMDQLAQGSSDHPAADWMSVLSEQTANDTSFVSPEPEGEGRYAPPAPATETPQSEPDAPFDSDVRTTPSVEAAEESFFADEAPPSASWSYPVEHVTPAPTETAAETIEAQTAEPLPLASSKTDESFQADSKPELAAGYQDPDLMQPPAVHVTPEPLLVEDDLQGTSHYEVAQQDLEPTHLFTPPVAPAPPVEEPPSPEALGSAEEPLSLLETKTTEVEGNERIPTGPPPSREALAEIPFLTPPPDFRTQPQEQATADPGTVDAVVQKVLEKLQPQLHDLLSQGVLKPLVENLLQNETAKKEK